MPRILALVFIVAFFALAAVACGDDDDNGGNNDRTPIASAEPTNEPEETPDGGDEDDGGDGDDDEKETPEPGETPDDGEPGPSPDFSATPAQRGTPATLIDDPAAWFAQNYPGVSPGEADCQYSIVEVNADCGGLGEFAPDPPLVSAGVECSVLIVNNEPVALRCTSDEPLTTAYYDILE